jgi:hypothetical protein
VRLLPLTLPRALPPSLLSLPPRSLRLCLPPAGYHRSQNRPLRQLGRQLRRTTLHRPLLLLLLSARLLLLLLLPSAGLALRLR